MRVLALFALLAAPAMAFLPPTPFKAPRAASALVVRMYGEYSEKVRPRFASASSAWHPLYRCVSIDRSM